MDKKVVSNGQQRPTSPFLMVYKPQITSIFSITERVTGMLLVFVVFGWLFLLKIEPMFLTNYTFYSICYSIVKGSVAGFFIGSLIFLVILCGVFHVVFGARYLYWDRVFNRMSIEEIEKSTPLLVGVTVFFALIIWLW